MSVINALALRNLKIFWRNKPALILNLIVPFFFIFVFGEIFALAGGVGDIRAYMLVGIVATMMFESSLRISSRTIEDISSGFMKEVLVSPVSRMQIAIGQFVSSAVISAVQGTLILAGGALIMGYRITTPMTVLWAMLAMLFIGIVFAGFGLMMAAKSKNMTTFQAVSMAITMPMTFISGAYIPVMQLPTFLQWVAYFNPLSYAVNFFRIVSLEATHLTVAEQIEAGFAFEFWGIQLGFYHSVIILTIFGAIFLALSTWTFARLDFSKLNRQAATFNMFE